MSALLVEERWRAEARYRAALEGKPGAPRLHTFRADANGNRVVSLDGDQIGYVANSGGTRPSWRGILGLQLETLVTSAPRMEDARERICVEYLRRLERQVTAEVDLARIVLKDLWLRSDALSAALGELRRLMLRGKVTPNTARERATALLSVLEVQP